MMAAIGVINQQPALPVSAFGEPVCKSPDSL
jgi:hypothetical protein